MTIAGSVRALTGDRGDRHDIELPLVGRPSTYLLSRGERMPMTRQWKLSSVFPWCRLHRENTPDTLDTVEVCSAVLEREKAGAS